MVGNFPRKTGQYSDGINTVVLVVAIVGTAAAIILAESPEEPSPWQDMLIRILMSASLGISLLIAFKVAAEKQRWSDRISLATQLGGIFLLASYYATLAPIMHRAVSTDSRMIGSFSPARSVATSEYLCGEACILT